MARVLEEWGPGLSTGSEMSRTYAAMQLQAVRMRAAAGESAIANNHDDILGAAVDTHHKNMSQLHANLPRHHKASEVRTMNSSLLLDSLHEVDAFSEAEGGEGDDEEGEAGAGPGRLQHLLMDSAGAEGELRVGSKKALEVDPLSVLRRIRSTAGPRPCGPLVPVLEAARRPVCRAADDSEDGEGLQGAAAAASAARGKSFLLRMETQGSTAGMLAQLRSHDSASSQKAVSRASMGNIRREPSTFSCRSAPDSPAPRSFTAGMGAARRPGALPGVSVNSSPRGSERNLAALGPQDPASGPGLLSKLKSIMKR